MTVKIYNPISIATISLSYCGNYVKYEDYEALQAQVNELAAENAELKKGFEKPQAYLSWHAILPTWSDPGGGGEYLAVHDGPGHKNDDGSECWPVFPKPELETPSTDAAIREIKANAVEYAANFMQQSGAVTFGECYVTLHKFAAQLRAGEVE